VTDSGVFLTHRRSPRIRRHFQRLVAESGPRVRWHFVYSHDTGPRPATRIRADDPAEVLAARYRAMAEHGGVQGGYLDTLVMPLLRALRGDHLWVCEYDVDFSGHWGDFFARYAGHDADLLTTHVMSRAEHPRWTHWQRAGSPAWVPEDRWVRSLNPLMRLSRRLVNAYCVAMADEAWRGHYEFTLPTAAVVAGLSVEDLGGDTSFTLEERRGTGYIGRTPDGKPPDMTFGFRPVRRHYFEERPEAFRRPGLLHHPVKPGVRAWTKETRNVR
jgi:hypothetical protein